VKDGVAVFCHVKISTRSSHLSHLFNQGSNSIQLLKSENKAVERLRALLSKRVGDDAEAWITPVTNQNCSVLYAIATHKDITRKSENLPIFSRISLMRNLKALRIMAVPVKIGFVLDNSARSEGTRKRRRRRPEIADAAHVSESA
jgi:uncharacterized protein (TIGR04141 family)